MAVVGMVGMEGAKELTMQTMVRSMVCSPVMGTVMRGMLGMKDRTEAQAATQQVLTMQITDRSESFCLQCQ